MKYLIVGGVAGGATVAARLRRLDEKAEIIIFEKGEHISCANCGLPYYIGGVIKDRKNLLLQTPQSFKSRFNIEVRVFNEVVAIDSEKKQVSVHQVRTGEAYVEQYDKLILSPGAAPIIPPIPGIDNDKILTLRNVSDTDKIKNYIEQREIKDVVVIGAGFIGLEMAENLHHLNIRTQVVEAAPQVMNAIDQDVASLLHAQFKQHGVGLYLNNGVKSFEDIADNKLRVNLQSGKSLDTQLVIFSIGVRPDSALAEKAGIELSDRGMIMVNERMETSKPDIYALGDAALFKNKITGVKQPFFLAGPANKQARILANNLVKNNGVGFDGAIGTAIAKVFSLNAGMTGLSEKAAKQAGIAYKVALIRAGSNAGYYPGATQMTIKLLFSPTDGKVLGAQVVGEKGVDKRIDMIATVLGMGGTLFDLQEIEHAYAPPFSSAKDPVNQVAFYAENIMDGMVEVVDCEEMKQRSSEVFVLDVRTKAEFELGAVEGAVNIAVDDLRESLERLPQDKEIFVYCKAGMRGYIASRILKQNGFSQVYNLSGGWDVYRIYNRNQENQLPRTTDGEPQGIGKSSAKVGGEQSEDDFYTKKVDVRGMQCPGPIIRLKEEIEELSSGDVLKIIASDAGFYNDVKSWCHVTGNDLISRGHEPSGNIVATIKKGSNDAEAYADDGACAKRDNKTMVVFSDDLDKALAAFVIANGAAAMGKKTTMFFTFWGLNIIKRQTKIQRKKDFMGNMFDLLLPSSSKSLNLSKMNMFGLGAIMMRKRMEDHHVDSLEEMIAQAIKSGVEIIACQMSMDLMGIAREDLLEQVNIGGVANYLERTEDANHNLFI